MKTKAFIAALLASGARVKPGSKSGHTVYLCPCGQHVVTIADAHKTIAATIVTTTRKRMPCVAHLI